MSDSFPNPLHAMHEKAGAEFQSYAGLEIVSTFGQPQAEYSAIRKGCALLDMPQRGVLELTGRDRLAFLNNLITNQTWDKLTKTGLEAGRGVYAFYLNTKGRIIADMNVLETGDGRTLLELDVRMVATVQSAFDRYLFGEQVKMTARLGTLHSFALLGPGATRILNELAGVQVEAWPQLASAVANIDGREVIIFRDDLAGVPGYGLIAASENATGLWTSLFARFGQPDDLGRRALRPVGWAAFNATRIEAARPLFDIDFGNSADPEKSVLPAETGPATFERAVSVTKGCYLGQEIVARMHARKQVAKQLVGLKMDDDNLPLAGSPLMDEAQNQIGIVTSSTVSPVLSGTAICLGYVKKPLFAEGTTLYVPAEGAVRPVSVVATPFVHFDA